MARQRIMLTVVKGALVPSDAWSETALRERGYRVGNILAAELRKARSPGFHRLAHAFAAILAENIEAFELLDAHAVLKRLQIEANVACEELEIQMPESAPMRYRIPRSLAFESLDESEFRELMHRLSAYVARAYWPTLGADEIAALAARMPAGL